MYKDFYKQTVLLLILFWSETPLHAQSKDVLDEVKRNLICQCSCQMTISACEGSMNCQFADNLTVEVSGMIKNGLSKEQIEAQYIMQYGEQILAAPTKRGFNLIVWILPYAAIIIAGIVIVKTLQVWVLQDRVYAKNAIKSDRKFIDSKYDKQLNEILRALD